MKVPGISAFYHDSAVIPVGMVSGNVLPLVFGKGSGSGLQLLDKEMNFPHYK